MLVLTLALLLLKIKTPREKQEFHASVFINLVSAFFRNDYCIKSYQQTSGGGDIRKCWGTLYIFVLVLHLFILSISMENNLSFNLPDNVRLS